MIKIQIRNMIIMVVLTIAMVFGVSVITAKEVVSYADGTYYGTATGNEEGIWVKVEIASGAIKSVEVVENHETVGICEPALENIPGKIVSANSPYVDAESGATKTSEGIKKAVISCLDQAAGTAEIVTYTAPEPKADPVPLDYSYTPGIYTATAEGFEDIIKVEVEFSENAIIRVTVLNSEDGEERVKLVNESVPSDMVKWNTYDVDVATGATWTSNAVIEAVEKCVNQAKK